MSDKYKVISIKNQDNSVTILNTSLNEGWKIERVDVADDLLIYILNKPEEPKI